MLHSIIAELHSNLTKKNAENTDENFSRA